MSELHEPRDWRVGDRCTIVTLGRRDPGPHPATVERVEAERMHVRTDDGVLYHVPFPFRFLEPLDMP